MAERYIRLHKSEQEYFLPGCPISVVAYAVLKDKKEEINLLQLKFKNCSEKTVSGVKLSVTTRDQLGQEIETVNNHQYAKLNAGKGTFFGSDSTISLSKTTPVSDIVIVLDLVLFSDGSKWKNGEGHILEACLPPQEMSMAFPKELIEEYRRVTNQHMKYIPEDLDGSWRCSCGSLNTAERCVICGTLKQDVFEKSTEEFLVKSNNERVYNTAIRLKTSTSVDSLSKAVALLKTIPNYKDSNSIINECNEAIKERTEFERKLNEEKEKAKEQQKQSIIKNRRLKRVILIAALSFILLFIIMFINKETKYESCEKTLMSSNSSKEEKRIALAYITNYIINERISYENSYDGEKDDAYYKTIDSIEHPLTTILLKCDLSGFIKDKELKQAFELYASSNVDLNEAIEEHKGMIEDIIDNKNIAIVPIYREGYLTINADDYKKCCEAYIADKYSNELVETGIYTKDPDATTWSIPVSIKNDTLAKLHNCEFHVEFYVGSRESDYRTIVDNWKSGEENTITFHVANYIGSASNIHFYCEAEIESVEMKDNNYIGDN